MGLIREEKIVSYCSSFVTGSAFRENMFTISSKCDEVVEAGMVFVVYLGVNDLRNSAARDEAGKKYAIAISDTVLVCLTLVSMWFKVIIDEDGGKIITEKAKSRLKSIMVRLGDDDGEKEDNKGSS